MRTLKKTTFGKYFDWYFGYTAFISNGKRMTKEDVTTEVVTDLLSRTGYNLNDPDELQILTGVPVGARGCNWLTVEEYTNFLADFDTEIFVEELHMKQTMCHNFLCNGIAISMDAIDVVFNQEFDEYFNPDTDAEVVYPIDYEIRKVDYEEFVKVYVYSHEPITL